MQEAARREGEDFQLVLTRYGLERLLYRLSQSTHKNTFVLKGAVLFQIWSTIPHRATRDVDFLARGDSSAARFEQIFRELCVATVEDDGLEFLPESVRCEGIKEDAEYQGLRIRMEARLERATIRFHFDIGFGDVITPAPAEVQYPTLLDFPGPRLLAYPKETVVAEKYQALVMLGMVNSRMKDFFDLWVMAREYGFDGTVLCQAIAATFARRQTELPADTPVGLSAGFASDAIKKRQWEAFVKKGRLSTGGIALEEVLSALRELLLPPSHAAANEAAFGQIWPAGGPWQSHH